MANKFFRPLISSVLVICLMHLQTSIAFAETKGVTEEKGVVKTHSDGSRSQSVAYNFSDVDESSMMATLTMIAIGLVSVSALRSYKNVTMDMKVALGAGAIYVAGEVYSNVSLKDKLEKMKIEFEKKSGESMQTQVEAFTDLKTAYTEAKKTIETKNMLQTAAAAAYATATGIATWTTMKQSQTLATLQADIKAKVMACGTLTAKVVTAVAGKACITQLNLLSGQLLNLEIAEKTPGPSLAKEAQLKAQMAAISTTLNIVPPPATALILSTDAYVKAAMAEKEISNTAGVAAGTTFNNSKKIFNHFPSLYFLDLFVSKAQASWTSIIGFLGASAVAYLTLAKTSLGAKVDTWMATPKLRIVAWGILTGLTAASLSANKKVIQDLDERIKKIDEILASLLNVENGAKIADSAISKVNKSNLLTGVGSKTILANAGSSNFKMDCVTSSASTNCPSLAKSITESPEFQELPITLQNLSKQTGNLGDALQGQSKLSDSTLASAGELGAQNNAIQGALKDSIEKAKKLDNGSDLDKAMDSARDDLLAATKSSADKVGGARSLYASLGGIPSNSSGNLNQAKNIAKEAQFAPSDSKAATVTGAKAKAKNNDFEFKLMNDNKEVAGTDSPVKIDNEELAKEMSKESIGSPNGPSIFEILSHRYYMSGYPKLLEEE